MTRVTRTPVMPSQVEEGAKALWDLHRELEGRVPWEDAAPWAHEPYELKAQLVLEAVLVDQSPEWMRSYAKYIQHSADIIEGKHEV